MIRCGDDNHCGDSDAARDGVELHAANDYLIVHGTTTMRKQASNRANDLSTVDHQFMPVDVCRRRAQPDHRFRDLSELTQPTQRVSLDNCGSMGRPGRQLSH